MKRLFFDMDGVLADFESGLKRIDEATLKEYEDAVEYVFMNVLLSSEESNSKNSL